MSVSGVPKMEKCDLCYSMLKQYAAYCFSHVDFG